MKWVKLNEDTWVNLEHVARISRFPSGKLLLYINGEKVPVEEPYSSEIVRLIEKSFGKRKKPER